MPRSGKILLALDGSEGALMTVKYAAAMAPFHQMKAVLFNVFGNMPEHFWDMEADSQFGQAMREMHAWEAQQRKQMEQYMALASKTLVNSGFSKQSVKVKIQNRKRGVARDILREAQEGYEWVMTGRKGISKLQEIVLGSVALKLLEKVNFLPIMLVENPYPNNKVLIAMDGSENAMRAVEFVGSALGGYDFQVTLVHVIRGNKGTALSHLFSTQETEEAAKRSIENVFTDAKAKLVDSGYSTDNIATRLITGVHSRAAAVMDEATQNDYGTIVVGRRGLSRTQEFFMGRVGNKIVNMAKNKTVWVIT
jgi:nucleotide-binding universal stress UspA family protein